MPKRAACLAAARAPCSRSRGRRSGYVVAAASRGMRRSCAAMRDAGRASIRGTAIGTIRIFLGAPGPRDERRPDVSPLAPGRAAGAETPAAATRGDEPAAAAAADRRSITSGRTTSCSTRAPTGGR